MISNIPENETKYLLLFVIVLCTWLFVYMLTPSIMLVALRRRLIDRPNKRKRHVKLVSNFGGLAIYCAITLVTTVFHISHYFPNWDFIFAASFILFLTGLKDDVLPLTPKQKFAAQFLAAGIVVVCADVRLTDFHGFLGFHELNYWVSISFSIIGIVFVTNAYNLIDGLDGLCGSLTLTQSILFTLYFLHIGNYGLSMLSIAIAGSLLGFLHYNKPPARIFMGDTGSLMMGFFAAFLALAVVNNTNLYVEDNSSAFYMGKEHLALATAIMIVPVFDAFRVFMTRIAHHRPPFSPDRRHIHHLLLDSGWNVKQIDASLIIYNVSIVALTAVFNRMDINPTVIILGQITVSFIVILLVMRMRNAHQKVLLKQELEMIEKKISLTQIHAN